MVFDVRADLSPSLLLVTALGSKGAVSAVDGGNEAGVAED